MEIAKLAFYLYYLTTVALGKHRLFVCLYVENGKNIGRYTFRLD